MLFDNPYETPPDFVNELGIKWWKDESMTQWAQREDALGTTLDVVCFFIELKDGSRSHVMVSKETMEIIAEDRSLEGMACKIDVLKLLKRDQEREKMKQSPVIPKKTKARGVKSRRLLRTLPPSPKLERSC